MHIGQNLVVYGGMDNSLSEHAAMVTFVHKNAVFTGSEQLGIVNVRVFLDSAVQDRVLRAVPVLATRLQAQEFNTRGGGYACYPVGDPDGGQCQAQTPSHPRSDAEIENEVHTELQRLARTHGLAFEEVQ